MDCLAIAKSTTLYNELVTDLTAELSKTDSAFSSDLLSVKVGNAIREVGAERKYPSHYSNTKIASDLENFYSVIRNIALYDYNMVGIEFQSASTENSNARTYVSREKLFFGVYPIAR